MDTKLALFGIMAVFLLGLSFAQEFMVAEEIQATSMEDRINDKFHPPVIDISLPCKIQEGLIGEKGGLLCPKPPYVIDGSKVYYESARGIVAMTPGLAESDISEKTQYMNYTYYPAEDNNLNISFVFDNEHMNYLTLEVNDGDGKWVPVVINKTILEADENVIVT